MTIKSKDISLTIEGKRIIQNINLEICPGKLVALLGPNGAGKSTVLKVLAGDIAPSQGTVEYENIDLFRMPIIERANLRSVMSQSQSIAFDFTVMEIIEMGWLHNNHEYYAPHYRDALTEIVQMCELQSLISRKFNTLSGGEQKRVHFARALLQLWIPETEAYPRYMLLDEPLANLDIYHELKILEIIKNHLSKNIGVLIILHDLNTANKFADNVALMKDCLLYTSPSPRDS